MKIDIKELDKVINKRTIRWIYRMKLKEEGLYPDFIIRQIHKFFTNNNINSSNYYW